MADDRLYYWSNHLLGRFVRSILAYERPSACVMAQVEMFDERSCGGMLKRSLHEMLGGS